jgi:hypothetical protein
MSEAYYLFEVRIFGVFGDLFAGLIGEDTKLRHELQLQIVVRFLEFKEYAIVLDCQFLVEISEKVAIHH